MPGDKWEQYAEKPTADKWEQYAEPAAPATAGPSQSTETQVPGMIGSVARFGQQAAPYFQTFGRELGSAYDAAKGVFTAPYDAATAPMTPQEQKNFPMAQNPAVPQPLQTFSRLGLMGDRMIAEPIANAAAWYGKALTGKIPNPVDQMLSVLPEAVGTGAGTEVGGKLASKAPNLAQDVADFSRRVKSIEDIHESASGHYQKVIQPQIMALSERMKAEAVKTIDQAIAADRAAQTVQGQGSISLSPTISELATKLSETKYYMPDAKMRTLQSLLTSNSMVSLDDAVALRSKFGDAYSRAAAAGDAKTSRIYKAGYDELGNAIGDRVEELQGSRAPFNHYNNEFKAHYELREGIAGQMMDSLAERSDAVDKLKKFGAASIRELQDQMDKYGMDPKKLAKAQDQAKSIVAASDSVTGKMNKSAYRILMGGGVAAATAASAFMVSRGAGMAGMIPMALAAYAGSVAQGMQPRIETGRLLRRYRMVPNASQVRTLAEGPRDFTYLNQDDLYSPKGAPPSGGGTPPAAPSPTGPPVDTSNFPTPASRAASDTAFNMRYRKGEVPGKPLDPIEGKAWDESMERRSTPRIDTDALSQAYVQARQELGQNADTKRVAKRAQQIVGISSGGGDIGDVARQGNPEPPRAKKAADIQKAKKAKGR